MNQIDLEIIPILVLSVNLDGPLLEAGLPLGELPPPLGGVLMESEHG